MITNEKLNNFIEVLQEVISSVAIYKAMESIHDDDKRPLIFNNIMNYSAMIATIRIANFMGSFGENNHWKNVFDSSHYGSITKEIFLRVFKTQNDYKAYHQNLTSFRNNYVTHFDFSSDLGVVIYFSDAIEIVFHFFDYIKNIDARSKEIILNKRISYNLGQAFYETCCKQTLQLFE